MEVLSPDAASNKAVNWIICHRSHFFLGRKDKIMGIVQTTIICIIAIVVAMTAMEIGKESSFKAVVAMLILFATVIICTLGFVNIVSSMAVGLRDTNTSMQADINDSYGDSFKSLNEFEDLASNAGVDVSLSKMISNPVAGLKDISSDTTNQLNSVVDKLTALSK